MTGTASQYVFVSHASQAKGRISALVQALVDREVRLWVDDPSKLTCSPETRAHLDSLRATMKKAWTTQLDDAVHHAGCVLVCLSKEATPEGLEPFTGRMEWHREIVKGEEKAVLCTVDDVDARGMSARFNVAQARRFRTDESGDLVDAEGQLDLLIRDIQSIFDEQAKLNEAAAEDQKEKWRNATALDVSLAGREDEEGEVRAAIAASGRSGGVYPLVIAGPRNELPGVFVDRLQHTMRAELGDVSWQTASVRWPERGEIFQPRYLDLLRQDLRAEKASVDSISTALSKLGQPITLVHTLTNIGWTEREPGRISEWLAIWKTLAATRPAARFLPILVLSLAKALPGWQFDDTKPRRGRAPIDGAVAPDIPTPAIWQALLDLEAEEHGKNNTSFAVVSLLTPIEEGEAQTWATHKDRGPAEKVAKLKAVNELYMDDDAQRRGVAYQHFSSHFEDKTNL